MFSCDYNGWADVPEEEREGIDLFELTQALPAARVWVPMIIVIPEQPLQHELERRAA